MRARDRLPDFRPSEFRDVAAALPPWLHAVGAAAGAACASAMIITSVVFFSWLAGASGMASAGQALSAGLGAWLLAHGASLSLGEGRADLTPWLLTLLPFFAARWSAGRLVSPDSAGVPRWARLGGLRRDVARDAVAFVTTYAVLACIFAVIARFGGVRMSILGSLSGGALLALLAYLLALRAQQPPSAWAPGATRVYRERAPAWAQAALRPALWGVLAALAAGLLLVLLMLGLSASRIITLYRELEPGIFGGAVVTLGQLAYLPTFVVWALAWMAGPGFGIGAGSSVTWTTSKLGLLPLVPAFGALPDPGPLPTWSMAAILVPLGVGALIGALVLRSAASRAPDATLARRVAAAAAACLIAAALLAAAAAAASGPVGAARLSRVGVSVPAVGAALLIELLVGASLVVLLGSIRVRRNEPQRASAPEGARMARRGRRSMARAKR